MDADLQFRELILVSSCTVVRVLSGNGCLYSEDLENYQILTSVPKKADNNSGIYALL